jgi:hypothetical protein
MTVMVDVLTEMDEVGTDSQFVLFSETHHAFDNPEAGTDPAARLVYSPLSAARARLEIEHFLSEVTSRPSAMFN